MGKYSAFCWASTVSIRPLEPRLGSFEAEIERRLVEVLGPDAESWARFDGRHLYLGFRVYDISEARAIRRVDTIVQSRILAKPLDDDVYVFVRRAKTTVVWAKE